MAVKNSSFCVGWGGELNRKFMKLVRSFLVLNVFIFLGLFPPSTYSEDWQPIQSGTDRDRMYFASDSIEIDDRKRFVWIMMDFSLPIMGVLSRKNRVQFDCVQKTYTFLRQILYEGAFGTGQSYATDIVTTDMKHVSGNPVMAELMKSVCGID